MSDLLEQLPLLHDGDAYFLSLKPESAIVHLKKIIRYSNNQNTVGEEIRFYDLDALAKHAVLTQIRRRYNNKTIQV